MRKIELTDEAKQRLVIPYEDSQIELILKYRPTVMGWFIDVYWKSEPVVLGKRLTNGILLLDSFNKPFDIILRDKSKLGLDPIFQDDFINRINFYIVERDELKEIRGYDVL